MHLRQSPVSWALTGVSSGQEGSSRRAHSTSSQQARGGGATERGSLGLLPTPSPPQVQNKMACNPVGAPHLQLWPHPGSPPRNTATMLTMASVYSPGLIGEQLDSADGLSFRGEKWNAGVKWLGYKPSWCFALQRSANSSSVHVTCKDRASISPPKLSVICTCRGPEYENKWLKRLQPFFLKKGGGWSVLNDHGGK